MGGIKLFQKGDNHNSKYGIGYFWISEYAFANILPAHLRGLRESYRQKVNMRGVSRHPSMSTAVTMGLM